MQSLRLWRYQRPSGVASRAMTLAVLISTLSFAPATTGAQTYGDPIRVDAKATSAVRSPFLLEAGRLYRLIVSGTYEYALPSSGVSLTANAECSYDSNNRPYVNQGRAAAGTTGRLSSADTLDLLVNGQNITWLPFNNIGAVDIDKRTNFVVGDVGCDSDHWFYYDYRAPRYDRLSFEVTDTFGSASGEDKRSDNEGTLSVQVVCIQETGIYSRAAVNRADQETSSAPVGCSHGQGASLNSLECDKSPIAAPNPSGKTAVGRLESAALTVDSRDNLSDPIGVTTDTAYYRNNDSWKQSGHWGVHTCNLAGLGATYRVVVTGTYRYDQTQSGSFGMADAECATGFRKSSEVVRDEFNTTATAQPKPDSTFFERVAEEPTSAGTYYGQRIAATTDRILYGQQGWEQVNGTINQQLGYSRPTATVTDAARYVPAYYRYFFENLERGRFSPPNEVRPITSDTFPNTSAYLDELVTSSGQGGAARTRRGYEPLAESDQEWLPNRFSYTVTQTTALGLQVNHADPGDLLIGFGTGRGEQFDWKPLIRNGSGNWVPADGLDCSPERAYYTDVFANSNARLRFRILDILEYNEWDNCGSLQIKVSMRTDQFEVPTSTAPFSSNDCHFVGPYWQPVTFIKDVQADEENPFNLQNSHAYYFAPSDIVVPEMRWTAKHGWIPTTLKWSNKSGPHSITAAIDKWGQFCNNVSTAYRPLPTVSTTLNRNQTTVSTHISEATVEWTSPSPPQPTTIGADDCDRDPARRGHRLFDSHPNCLGTVDQTRQFVTQVVTSPLTSSYCTTPGSEFSWTVSLPWVTDGGPNNFCTGNYCTIPYFCRVAPDTMRGNIIIKR